jgi:predicted peptidase
MRHALAIAAVSMLMAMGCASHSHDPPHVVPGEQTPQALHQSVSHVAEVRYLLYLPEDYARDSQKSWPLVIFLHGAGERGDDLEKIKLHGPPMLVAKGKQFPFVLVSPQCPANSYWHIDDLEALLDDALSRYHIDRDRVYVTGLSLGGWGTWQWITYHPERFAAAVPICGAGDPFLIGWIVKLPPVWAFHGADDKVVPPIESQRMIDKIHEKGGEAKLTIYPGVGHDSWKKAYDDPDMWEWLLAHKRSDQK